MIISCDELESMRIFCNLYINKIPLIVNLVSINNKYLDKDFPLQILFYIEHFVQIYFHFVFSLSKNLWKLLTQTSPGTMCQTWILQISWSLSYIHISTFSLFLIRDIWCEPYLAVRYFSRVFPGSFPALKLTTLLGVAGATWGEVSPVSPGVSIDNLYFWSEYNISVLRGVTESL